MGFGNEDVLAEILNLCESDPDAGLEFIEKTLREKPGSADDPFGRFARAIAYGSKGLFQLIRNMPSLDYTGYSEGQMRNELGVTDSHLEYLEKGLQEINEMERIRPGALALFGKQAELKVDGMAVVLERCRPGRVHEILGKTKLLYFGPDRVVVRRGCEITQGEFNFFRNIFFTCRATPKSALVSLTGFDGNRSYVGVALFRNSRVFDESGEKSPFACSVFLYSDGTSRPG